MRLSHRSGFTLVELLVVVAIIGILVGLLLPAVQAARESARNTQCKNNLKQLALGVQSFHDSRKRMPTYWGYDRTKSSAETNFVYGNWFVHILPFVEQQNVYDIIAEKGAPGYTDTEDPNDPRSADYKAGSTSCTGGTYHNTGTTTNPGKTTSHVGHTHTDPPTTTTTGYWDPPRTCTSTGAVGNPGTFIRSYNGIDASSDKLFEVLQCPSDPSKNETKVKWRYGNFWSVSNYLANWHAFTDGTTDNHPHTPLANTPVSIADILDGTSHTVIFGEAYSRCDNVYRFAMWGDCRIKTNNNSYPAYPASSFGINWYKKPNTLFAQFNVPPQRCNNWRLQSGHAAGLNVALLDGSVRTLRPSVSRQEQSDPQLDGTMAGQDPYPIDLDQAVTDGLALGVWDRLLLPRDGNPDISD